MPLDEGIESKLLDLFHNIIYGFIALIVTYLAWLSTNVREDRVAHAAVLIIENNRRRNNHRVPASAPTINSTTSTQPPSASSEDSQQLSGAVPEGPIEPIPLNTLDPTHLETLRSSIDDITQMINDVSESSVDFETEEELLDDFGPREIIDEMDRDFPDTTDGIRHRTNNVATATVNSFSNSTNTNETVVDSEIIANEPISNAKQDEFNAPTENKASQTALAQIRIKLKYLNDDLKLVSGSLDEFIGDFKQRNFTDELASQKLVRLVFNGHVLQPDTKTLGAFGLFDNCVVHCLVHNKKANAVATQNSNPQEARQNETGSNNGPSSPDNSNQYFYIYLGICFVALTLGFCWFCRIQHSYLFTLYSTIGLVLITTIFLTMIPLLILIER